MSTKTNHPKGKTSKGATRRDARSGSAEFSMLMGRAFQGFMEEFEKLMAKLLSKEEIDRYVRAMKGAKTESERKAVEKEFFLRHKREFDREIRAFEKHMGALAKNMKSEGRELKSGMSDIEFESLEKDFMRIAKSVADNERRFFEKHRRDLGDYRRILGDCRMNLAGAE